MYSHNNKQRTSVRRTQNTKRTNTYTVNPYQTKGRPRKHTLTREEMLWNQTTEAGLRATWPIIRKPILPWNRKEIYIDGEWHLDTTPKKFYLLGYAFNQRDWGWLYNQNDYTYGTKVMAKPKLKGINGLNKTRLLQLFDGVKTIYFYGPDAGQIESMYHIKLKDKYRCVNLLAVVRKVVPVEDMWNATQQLIKEGVLERYKYTPQKPCYRLCVVEELLGIKRSTLEYKKDVDNLHRDWYTPHLRAKALLYNKEDVLNLIKMKKALYKKYNVPKDIEEQCTLQITKQDKLKFKSRK